MKDSARYRKIVEWSEEDQCFVGRAPDLMMGGCHGPDERAVFDELCQIVEEWIDILRKDGKQLPPSSPRLGIESERHFVLLTEAVRGLEDVGEGRVSAARQALAKNKAKGRRRRAPRP